MQKRGEQHADCTRPSSLKDGPFEQAQGCAIKNLMPDQVFFCEFFIWQICCPAEAHPEETAAQVFPDGLANKYALL